MADHPEFPQASPAMKYIIDQVSKIEEAQACGVGYYKSLGKVLARLDKTDQELNQLKKINTDLKEVIDTTIISKTIGAGLVGIKSTVDIRLGILQQNTEKSINDSMKALIEEQKKALEQIGYLNAYTEQKTKLILGELEATSKKIHNHISPPWWKIWGLRILLVLLGIGIGIWVK